MKESTYKKLQKAIQGEVFSCKEFREFYSVDASSYKIIPKIIVFPKNERDVISAIKIAKKNEMSVTVRGAGTGLVGSALNDGIILDMKNFNSIKIEKNHITVGPGTIKGNLDKQLEKHKKFFPPNPSIGSFCSVGGMLGNNSSGSRSLKYGSVIDNVKEVTFIDGRGKKTTLPKDKKIASKILKLARKMDVERFPNVTKNSSGYRMDRIKTRGNAHEIIVGSEGTLGIITSAKLKIRDNPSKRILFVIEYKSTTDAVKNCIAINSTSPSAIEFVDETTLNQIKFKFNADSKSLLFVEYDEKIVSNERRLKHIITGKIAKKLQSKKEMHAWWRYRDASLHYSLKSIKKEKRIPHIIEDAAVPLKELPELFSILDKINKKYDTKSIVYGHAGNGNMHVRMVSEKQDKAVVKKIATEYFHEIIKIKGTITAEHGDGLARSEFVERQYGTKNYQIFKEFKKLFDPNGILNPGKIITNKSTMIKNID
ncbi:MAG: FAD-binding protein [Nitrosopumilus sp.]|nr:MAG: FAD-binding protein [Nitrosopumilus sp.]